jgi:hypothetical protein
LLEEDDELGIRFWNLLLALLFFLRCKRYELK